MFQITHMYKIALLPFPAIFITAFSEVPSEYLLEVSRNILANIVKLLEKAQNTYEAVIIVNEPTNQTHNLNFDSTENVVAVCCSLRFQNVTDMNNFIQKEIKNQQ